MKSKPIRSPYYVRVRNTQTKKEVKLFGNDPEKGVETLTASEHGAVVTRIWRHNGATFAKVRLIPWKDSTNRMRGLDTVLFEGPIDGEWPNVSLIPGQVPMFE